MWSVLFPKENNDPVPTTRSKHSATLVGHNLYLLGGKNGNLALKDFWKYNLVDETWQQIHPKGDRIPPLQEHTTIHYRDKLYVFGGEVGFSSVTEAPLWSYDIKSNVWKKIQTQKGASAPKGRRGHSALVLQDSMLIFGGYQDLKGSTNQLWIFQFDSEMWYLLFENISKRNISNNSCPTPRHKHSAIIHYDSMWIYGGMTDLQENSDLWRWNFNSNTWHQYKTKFNPGPLHSHAVCSLPEAMLIFGGERSGKINNELWRFRFDAKIWERINTNNIKPQPCTESVALTISELFSNQKKDSNVNFQLRQPSINGYNNESEKGNFLMHEISKLSSQFNLTRSRATVSHDLNNKSMSMVKSKSAFVIDKKRHSFIPTIDEDDDDFMTDFHSTVKRGQNLNNSRNFIDNLGNGSSSGYGGLDRGHNLKREPISVPNFKTLTLPTPVLTPVEASRLVFVDSDDEISDSELNRRIEAKEQSKLRADENNFKTSESYSSHLNYQDNSLLKQYSLKKGKQSKCELTSDYASNETMSGLLSVSNYSIRQLANGTKQDDKICSNTFKLKKLKNSKCFSNPNYFESETKTANSESNTANNNHPFKCKHQQQVNAAKLLNTPDSVLEDSTRSSICTNGGGYNYQQSQQQQQQQQPEEYIELKKLPTNEPKMRKSQTCKKLSPPKSLELDSLNDQRNFCSIPNPNRKIRSHSTSRLETHLSKMAREHELLQTSSYFDIDNDYEDYLPSSYLHYIILIGGKEKNQINLYEKPISMWKLRLF